MRSDDHLREKHVDVWFADIVFELQQPMHAGSGPHR